jgi:tetratricopeptide (TPR) repeat protein
MSLVVLIGISREIFMDLNNPVIKLCLAGTQAEFEGRIEDARSLYEQAWLASQDDYEACIAAHYLARYQVDPQVRLHWNREALKRANAVDRSRVEAFYPSLYLNMGRSYELLGNREEARRYYELAAELGMIHQVDYQDEREK